MPFSKQYLTIAKRVVLFSVLALFVGCASTGGKKKEKQAEQEPGVFVPIPNPYQSGAVPEQAKAEYKKVQALMAEKKWKDARGLLTLMVETYPNLSGPYINLGIAHFRLNEYDDAEKALSFAIETNPANMDAYPLLGNLYREQGRFEEAEAVYLKGLDVWPHHFDTVKSLGVLYDLYMGKLDQAVTYYKLAQNIAGGEDRQLKGWIVDLERRLKN